MAQSAFFRMQGTARMMVSWSERDEKGDWRCKRLTGVDSVEEVRTLLLLFDIRVDEKRVGFRVDILHHNLKPVEAACFWYLNFTAESLDEVLVDDAIGRSKESEDMGDEVPLIVIQSIVPVVKVL